MLAVLGAGLGLLPIACKVDRGEFNRRVFACDTAAPDPGCGTDEDGHDMACFAARQIGATDFCAKVCQPGVTPPNGDVCLPSEIELRSCRPSEDASIGPGKACDQPGLACYRTDLLADEGVCTTLNPCSQDTDCRDPVRSVCATSFLETTIYPDAGDKLLLDHLFCLQTGCRARGTSCSPGETCLQEVVPPETHAADICVPNCDSNLRCPPNFLCYKKVSTSIAPNVCIPGLLGFTCDSSTDCMVGTCLDTTIGYSVCTTSCSDESECQRFDGEQGKFTCVKNPANPSMPGLCQTPDAYRGSICNVTADCLDRNPDEVCSRFDPTAEQGVCLLPCLSDRSCPQRGGINHTCLDLPGDPVPVCFPGYFGTSCADSSNCVGDLRCYPTGADTPSICSARCETDADCGKMSASGQGNRWVGGDGFCGAEVGNPICLPNGSLPAGLPCHANAPCASGKCTNNVCAPVPS